MPVNYQEIQRQIKEMGQQAPRVQQELQDRIRIGQELLAHHANDLDGLRLLVQQTAEKVKHLRCAEPANEALDFTFGPPPASPAPPVLLAADGSQVNPSRHARIEFGLINVGVFRICPGQGLIPEEKVVSKLLYQEDLDSEQERLTEELLALQRDSRERQLLAELASQESQDVVTLTDGPLELYSVNRDDRRFGQELEKYLDVLSKLASMNVATAGYVDKPASDLVVRLLELALLRNRPEAAGREHPLRGLTDAVLFRKLLQPGQRTAIFKIRSSTAEKFTGRLDGKLGLHFFYLNVGRERQPSLARVEIPAWVVIQPHLVNLLHGVLLQQCACMGNRPYPYALHRAHEIALVTFSERQQLEDLIIAELDRQRLPVADPSNKQYAKDLSPRRSRR
ncbi:MAG TPA: DNA double-strand break repair nuclease NurA [Anaerolineaceae bacterium]|nr:DNA double-strand break repair nuclease NurA [Anaerolineaceae bacterium]